MRLWAVEKRQPSYHTLDGSSFRGHLDVLNPPLLPSIPPVHLAVHNPPWPPGCCLSPELLRPSCLHHPPLIPLMSLLLLLLLLLQLLLLLLLQLLLLLPELLLQDFVLLMCGALGRCSYSTSTIEVRAEEGRGRTGGVGRRGTLGRGSHPKTISMPPPSPLPPLPPPPQDMLLPATTTPPSPSPPPPPSSGYAPAQARPLPRFPPSPIPSSGHAPPQPLPLPRPPHGRGGAAGGRSDGARRARGGGRAAGRGAAQGGQGSGPAAGARGGARYVCREGRCLIEGAQGMGSGEGGRGMPPVHEQRGSVCVGEAWQRSGTHTAIFAATPLSLPLPGSQSPCLGSLPVSPPPFPPLMYRPHVAFSPHSGQPRIAPLGTLLSERPSTAAAGGFHTHMYCNRRVPHAYMVCASCTPLGSFPPACTYFPLLSVHT